MAMLFDHGVWIDLLPEAQSQLWQHCEAEYADPVLRWQVYINQLCLQGVLPWLQDEFRNDGPIHSENSGNEGTGIAVTVGARRLIVIPSEDIDQSELRVPQSWVDDPHCPGDYYLAVQVDPDEGQMHVWGYADHETLAQHSIYDGGDRAYSLDRDVMVTDLTVLTVAHQLGVVDRVEPSQQKADRSLQSETETRQGSSQAGTPSVNQASGAGETNALDPIDLSQWFTSIRAMDWVAQGWQLLDGLFPPSTGGMAIAFRGTSSAVDETEQGQSRGKRLELLGPSGAVGTILVVRVVGADDGRLAMRVQLCPERETTLPEGVSLALLSPSGAIVQSVESRALDAYIQLKRFRLPPGTRFSLQVKWGDTVMTESFSTGQPSAAQP